MMAIFITIIYFLDIGSHSMRYLSIIVFIVALVLSWNIIHTASAVSYNTHVEIQQKLVEYIVQTIQQQRPTAKNIVMQNIWTETLSDHSVKAYIDYNFDDVLADGSATQQNIKGSVVLVKKETHGEETNWVIDSRDLSNNSIVFEGSIISPEEETTTPPPASPAPTHSEPKTK